MTARAIALPELIDVRERREICDLFLELGPDAPTLCEGWTTADLAAHMVLREHYQRWGDKRRATEKAKGFPAVVARLRAGAPLIPWRLPRLRNIFNGLEFFIHHEDVRRANGQGPRPQEPDLEALSWRMSGFNGRRLSRAIRPYGIELVNPEGARRSYGSGTVVTLTGPASEMVLYMGGRRATAHVTLGGAPEAIAALEAADLKT
jgi:uncharacterized protein (TIGR03085 family)